MVESSTFEMRMSNFSTKYQIALLFITLLAGKCVEKVLVIFLLSHPTNLMEFYFAFPTPADQKTPLQLWRKGVILLSTTAKPTFMKSSSGGEAAPFFFDSNDGPILIPLPDPLGHLITPVLNFISSIIGFSITATPIPA